jgi:hypothetical protein
MDVRPWPDAARARQRNLNEAVDDLDYALRERSMWAWMRDRVMSSHPNAHDDQPSARLTGAR